MGIRAIKEEGDVFKMIMELKSYSEECLKCKCRTCQKAYFKENKSICNTYCEENCNGDKHMEFIAENECHIPINNSDKLDCESRSYRQLKKLLKS